MDEQKTPLLQPKHDEINPVYSSVDRPPAGSSTLGATPEVVIESDMDIKVYRRRWYILLVYSLFAGTQGGVWNTWGPISTSAYDVFGWGSSDISLLTDWGPISYLISAGFFSWMIETKGLRWACLSSMLLIAVGCGLRCISSTLPAVTWLVNTGHFLNGLGGPIAMAAPPVLSAVWFPPKERTTCTAASFAITNIMMACVFILGPLLVPQGTNSTCSGNHTHHKNVTDFDLYEIPETAPFWDNNNCTNSSGNIEEERNGIMFLMYVEFGWSLAILLLMLVYFPKKPPRPPCVTASLAREKFWTGFKKLFSNGQFWLLALVYGVALGVVNCWASVLDVNLAPLGISEMEAGFIGFYSTCSGCVASLIVARCADLFSKHLKWFILSLFVISCGFFTWFALACAAIVPSSTAILYVTVIIGMTAVNAAVPLIFEMSCELTYPIGEGTTNGVLTTVNNLGGLIFLGVLMIPDIHTMWMNWTVLGAVGICIPLLVLLQESYVRFNIDASTPNLHERKTLQ
ncbi:solute carrier family 49 member 4 homolog isoform X2 [Gigantopelta aegis]|uniref:solute carrier family 49 member 4 homolog isoform X2 n=1 Tax=Gigantopelta aegis TaxID=1735272 RepID=UPI001B88CDB6|nr:solute carrier family 49 member 4 homolog isoform X2 [Gigantopelta aegis]